MPLSPTLLRHWSDWDTDKQKTAGLTVGSFGRDGRIRTDDLFNVTEAL